MDGDDEAVVASGGRAFVVILRDQGGHRARQFLGEGGPVRRGGEPYLAVHRERGQALIRLGRAGDEITGVPHELRGEREQPAGGQPVRCPRGVGRHRREGSR